MQEINKIREEFAADVGKGLDAESLKTKYFSRKHGLISKAFEALTNLDMAGKKAAGKELNLLKQEIENRLLSPTPLQKAPAKVIDLTLPPLQKAIGHLHPLTQTQKQLGEIFNSLGFYVVQGPEIESDWYNFTALNFPADHPARDMQDTFFIKSSDNKKMVMRTHTSPMQVRFMQKQEPPFAIIVPGKVYRNEATDATHEHTFDQLEGLVVGENINFANMIWIINRVFKKFFGDDAKIKVLPTYFPFVEPGAEVLMSSRKFKNGAWIEMGGCGMVHQNVFKAAGYKNNNYQGFAFGFGVIRFPLMKHGITDIRLLHENDLEFLNQF